MKARFAGIGIGLIGILGAASTAQGSFHLWDINEIYSNADGTVQYVELFTTSNSQQFTNGRTINSTLGGSTNSFVFPSDTPSPTANHHLLLATSAFASLPGGVTPDFTISDGFLFAPAGQVDFALADLLDYTGLPTDGVNALDGLGNPIAASPTNYAGEVGSVPEPSSMALLVVGGLTCGRARLRRR